MPERILITRIKRTSATGADLFQSRHKYADLRLFDLGELQAIGIDAAALPLGEERPVRFYATYELSEKLNQAGHPYKDIIPPLERVDGPATVASVDNSGVIGELRAIVAESRAIRAILGALAEAQGLTVATTTEPAGNGDDAGDDGPGELDQAFPRYLDAPRG